MKNKQHYWKDDFFWNDKVYVPFGAATVTAAMAVGLTDVQNILDLGTGCGCILCSLLRREFPKAVGIGTDINPEAIALAKKNSKALGLEKRTTWIESSWCASVPRQQFDLIITDPPYLEKGADNINEKIRGCPDDSVYGGLSMFKEMLASIHDCLPQPRYFISEVGGCRQISFVMELLEQHGYKRVCPVLIGKEPNAVVGFRDIQ